MYKKIKYLFGDKSFVRFIIVGVINTIVGTAIMLVFYNVFHLDYWFSSASDYVFASVLSYFLNKYYTFKNKEKGWKPAIRFVANIVTCYIIAFSLARPIVRWILYQLGTDLSVSWIENIAMLFGSGLFVLINYLGQRFFAFKTIKQE